MIKIFEFYKDIQFFIIFIGNLQKKIIVKLVLSKKSKNILKIA